MLIVGSNRLRTLTLPSNLGTETGLLVQERTFNPYYAHLLAKLCTFSRTHTVTFTYKFRDQLAAMDDMK